MQLRKQSPGGRCGTSAVARSTSWEGKGWGRCSCQHSSWKSGCLHLNMSDVPPCMCDSVHVCHRTHIWQCARANATHSPACHSAWQLDLSNTAQEGKCSPLSFPKTNKPHSPFPKPRPTAQPPAQKKDRLLELTHAHAHARRLTQASTPPRASKHTSFHPARGLLVHLRVRV